MKQLFTLNHNRDGDVFQFQTRNEDKFLEMLEMMKDKVQNITVSRGYQSFEDYNNPILEGEPTDAEILAKIEKDKKDAPKTK